MEAGSKNEQNIRSMLPSFLRRECDIIILSAREYDLTEMREQAYSLATSPHMIGAIMLKFNLVNNTIAKETSNFSEVIAFEFKTFSGLESLNKAEELAEKYEKYKKVSVCMHISSERDSREGNLLVSEDAVDKECLKIFRDSVPWAECRYKLLPHAAVLNSSVMFVTFSRAEILYIAQAKVSPLLLKAPQKP